MIEAGVQRAGALYREGRWAEAQVLFAQSLAAKRDDIGAMLGLGRCMIKQGDFRSAVEVLRRAVKQMPMEGGLRVELAEACRGAGEIEVAIRAYEEAVRLMPGDERVVVNLAGVLGQAGRHAESLATLRRAHAMPGGDIDPRRSRALVEGLISTGDPADALAMAKKLAMFPVSPPWVTEPVKLRCLGIAHWLAGDHDAGIDHLTRAVAAASVTAASETVVTDPVTDPLNDAERADIRNVLGMMYLAVGRNAEGYALLRSRHCGSETAGLSLPKDVGPMWDGSTDVAGKRVYVMCEQGAGDAVQFARYLPALAERVGGEGEVLVGCSTVLAGLMAQVRGVKHAGPEVPAHDFAVALLDLPAALGLQSEVGGEPYLSVDPSRSERMRALVRTRSGGTSVAKGRRELLVGLCWTGNPRQPVNARRAIDPGILVDGLKDLAGVRLVSLQKVGLPGKPTPKGVVDVMGSVHDFADTAALMAAMDVVITTDTSVAHLAGALRWPGEAWVLLHNPAPHWTWGTAGDSTPWYGRARLFRQGRYGDWAGVVAGVRGALEKRLSSAAANDTMSA